MCNLSHTHQEGHHRCIGGRHERAGVGRPLLYEQALQLVVPREVQQILQGHAHGMRGVL